MSTDNKEGIVDMSEERVSHAQSCIGRARKYSFDNRKPVDLSHLLVQAILADLTDRRGIKNTLDVCDDEIRMEIVDALSAIIRIGMNSKKASGSEILGKFRLTERGFQAVEFSDSYGVSSSLQESSAADSQHLWLGPNDGNPQILASDARRLGLRPANDATTGWVPYAVPKEVLLATRMHLGREQVQGLVNHLTHWLEHGTLEIPGG
jgi:hypothetical protein